MPKGDEAIGSWDKKKNKVHAKKQKQNKMGGLYFSVRFCKIKLFSKIHILYQDTELSLLEVSVKNSIGPMICKMNKMLTKSCLYFYTDTKLSHLKQYTINRIICTH